ARASCVSAAIPFSLFNEGRETSRRSLDLTDPRRNLSPPSLWSVPSQSTTVVSSLRRITTGHDGRRGPRDPSHVGPRARGVSIACRGVSCREPGQSRAWLDPL